MKNNTKARPVHKKAVPARKGAKSRGSPMSRAARSVPQKAAARAVKAAEKPKVKVQKVEMPVIEKVKPEEIIARLLKDQRVVGYIRQNVSKRASDVIQLLDKPRTDEQIATALEIKINAARRILNILQGYGVTNYTTQKDEKGWLSFFWYINTNKVDQFLDYIKTNHSNGVLSNTCNDYFICKNCYDENKLVFNFDSAVEANFKCTCNSAFARVDRSFVEAAMEAELVNGEPSL
jgi:transcription factor E